MIKFKVTKKTLRDGWKLCRANDNHKMIDKGLGKKVRSYYYFTYGNDRGYIAFSEYKGGIKVTVSVAGTDDIQDWKENARTQFDGMGRHKGFRKPAKIIWEDIIVPHIAPWRNIKALDFRAHSRGGAICLGMMELAADIPKDYPWGSNITGIVYGAPMYGDERWKVRVSAISRGFLRVENEFDPVPTVPPEIWGYVKECDVFKIKQAWVWRFLPIRSHLWYWIMIKGLKQNVIDKFNNR